MNIRVIYEFGRLDRVLLALFVRGDSEIPRRPSVAIACSLTDILPCPRHLTHLHQLYILIHRTSVRLKKMRYGSAQSEITVDIVCK